MGCSQLVAPPALPDHGGPDQPIDRHQVDLVPLQVDQIGFMVVDPVDPVGHARVVDQRFDLRAVVVTLDQAQSGCAVQQPLTQRSFALQHRFAAGLVLSVIKGYFLEAVRF